MLCGIHRHHESGQNAIAEQAGLAAEELVTVEIGLYESSDWFAELHRGERVIVRIRHEPDGKTLRTGRFAGTGNHPVQSIIAARVEPRPTRVGPIDGDRDAHRSISESDGKRLGHPEGSTFEGNRMTWEAKSI